MVAHYVRDVGVGRSSRLFPTRFENDLQAMCSDWGASLVFLYISHNIGKTNGSQTGTYRKPNGRQTEAKRELIGRQTEPHSNVFWTFPEKKIEKACLYEKEFLSLHPLNSNRVDPLAQLVEHNTFNVGVLGSSPKRITDKVAISRCNLFSLKKTREILETMTRRGTVTAPSPNCHSPRNQGRCFAAPHLWLCGLR